MIALQESGGLSHAHWAVAFHAWELADGWRRRGDAPECAAHHFAGLGVGTERSVRRLLNELVAAGVMRPVYDSRGRKCWVPCA